MPRRREHALDRTNLGDLAEVHDCDAIGKITNDAHIVRDEQVRCGARLQVTEQLRIAA